VLPPSEFSVFKNFGKNAFLKIACRTGLKTAVWISLPKKFGV